MLSEKSINVSEAIKKEDVRGNLQYWFGKKCTYDFFSHPYKYEPIGILKDLYLFF
jgi:hypothetical protein